VGVAARRQHSRDDIIVCNIAGFRYSDLFLMMVLFKKLKFKVIVIIKCNNLRMI
jgi:hypothetical protein